YLHFVDEKLYEEGCKTTDKINELISSTNNSNEIKEDDITGLIGTIIFSIVAMTIGILIAVGLSSR
ncbi:hypothetical protein, partial [Butyricimonas paravirosa]